MARRRSRRGGSTWREALRRIVPARWRGPLRGRWPAPPEARRWRAWLEAARRWPRTVWVPLGLAVLLALGVAYQLARKPTELLGAVAPSSTKTPQSTWRAYGPLFGAH